MKTIATLLLSWLSRRRRERLAELPNWAFAPPANDLTGPGYLAMHYPAHADRRPN